MTAASQRGSATIAIHEPVQDKELAVNPGLHPTGIVAENERDEDEVDKTADDYVLTEEDWKAWAKHREKMLKLNRIPALYRSPKRGDPWARPIDAVKAAEYDKELSSRPLILMRATCGHSIPWLNEEGGGFSTARCLPTGSDDRKYALKCHLDNSAYRNCFISTTANWFQMGRHIRRGRRKEKKMIREYGNPGGLKTRIVFISREKVCQGPWKLLSAKEQMDKLNIDLKWHAKRDEWFEEEYLVVEKIEPEAILFSK
ncbi:hypothetical protein BT63DRAFT_428916 [Microthyrium microscopicum]|uniref:DUF7587 domain-containing protein n=1 Tax=Microthyrium microscopicum TaxID=703497 RepID=A0A6A6U1Z5_9PEZI|nr:hypothetical protein BT63DRAFT_428916 [Microthyrium microscopicum]